MQDDGHGAPLVDDDGVAPLDPREALRRDRERRGPSAGLVFLRTIAAEERRWMEKMVVAVAAEYNVDRDDLLQDLTVSLLDNESIDAGRTGHRTWLKRRARWKAADVRRAATRHPTESLESTGEPPAPKSARIDADWDVDSSWRLTRNEIQIVRLISWGLDYSMRDLSDLLGRNYASIRQDKCRALRKIEKRIGLSPDELAAFLAYRRFPTYAEAADQLGVPERELRARLAGADAKFLRVLRQSVLGDIEEGGRSDAF